MAPTTPMPPSRAGMPTSARKTATTASATTAANSARAIFRDGRQIEVPAGNRRGERLRPGDEIYLGRACLRFEE